ncbi:MAG: NAD(P)/FAD-dependent oxidoreductase [Candidatus Bathyarchaeaceae archaeon]
MQIVIIGAGAAGLSAAETIRKHSAESEITVVSKERSLPYSPVALPEYIEGKISKEQLLLWNADFIKKEDINFIQGKAVVQINPHKKEIALDDGTVLSYGKLLIASGASPIVTEDLRNRKGVFTLRTLEDAEAICHQIRNRVVIYGAGAVATKIAVSLSKRGIDVIILCRSRILRRLFDEDICRLIHDLLIINGVKIVGLHEQTRIIGDPVELLRIGTQEFKCDGILAALGVTPNTSFLNNQIIRLGTSGGIMVNEKMETSAADIYAAGDCVETRDIISGKSCVTALWPPAVEQGRVAALNILGINAVYEGTLSQNMIDVFDTSFASIGSLDGEKINISKHGALNRFTIEKGKVIGAQLVGNVDNAGSISSCIKKGIDINDLRHLKLIFSGKLHFNISSLFRQYIENDNVKGG